MIKRYFELIMGGGIRCPFAHYETFLELMAAEPFLAFEIHTVGNS